jgi:hypothetical protein
VILRTHEDEDDDEYDESGDEDESHKDSRLYRTYDREKLLAICQEELVKYDNLDEYDDEYDESDDDSDSERNPNLVARFRRQRELEEKRQYQLLLEQQRAADESRNRMMRASVARELLDTERSYADSLALLIEVC